MFANNSEFFDGSQGQSVIVRQPQQQPPPNEEFGSPFPVTSSSCLPSTPITPGYSGYSGQFPFPFIPPELAQTFAQSFLPPPDHLPNIGNLNSPLIPNPAFGGGLNHLNNRFGNPSRSNLQYDFSSSGNYMGGSKPRKGGRRPGDEMDDCGDPDEVEKRLKRRQRNKEAAARCRQRRLDLMQSLQEQVSREKEQNMLKEKEIANVRQTLEAVVDFLRAHMGHLPDADRAKFDEIVATLGKEQQNGTVFKSEPVEIQPSSINEYLPQQANRPQIHVGSKRALLPPTSDISILEPELKKKFQAPKIESNLTLSSVNGGGDVEVSRPTTLDISSLSRAAPSLSTPSNGLSTNLGYFNTFRGGDMPTSLFGDIGGTCNFLTQQTGLTPSATHAISFPVETPTPLQNSEADLRPL